MRVPAGHHVHMGGGMTFVARTRLNVKSAQRSGVRLRCIIRRLHYPSKRGRLSIGRASACVTVSVSSDLWCVCSCVFSGGPRPPDEG